MGRVQGLKDQLTDARGLLLSKLLKPCDKVASIRGLAFQVIEISQLSPDQTVFIGPTSATLVLQELFLPF